jgi:hypothetical protein
MPSACIERTLPRWRVLRLATSGGSDGGQAARDTWAAVLLRFSLSGGMCYNHRAVERAWKQEVASVRPKLENAVSAETASRQDEQEAMSEVDRAANAGNEDASRYCPVCSQRLESRRCKLVCPVCGYYMSCADYY